MDFPRQAPSQCRRQFQRQESHRHIAASNPRTETYILQYADGNQLHVSTTVIVQDSNSVCSPTVAFRRSAPLWSTKQVWPKLTARRLHQSDSPAPPQRQPCFASSTTRLRLAIALHHRLCLSNRERSRTKKTTNLNCRQNHAPNSHAHQTQPCTQCVPRQNLATRVVPTPMTPRFASARTASPAG